MKRFLLVWVSLFMVWTSPAFPLNILVSNDDSCNSEGINALVDTLESAGHTVTMYAPAGEQSGKSSSISTNIFVDYGVSNIGFAGPTSSANRFCVRVPTESPEEGAESVEFIASASPFDSVLVGLQLMLDNRPDLVISGINDGANIGRGTVGSGTIGGAVAALQRGIPGIAVSRARFDKGGSMTFAAIANLVAKVVAELEAKRAEGQPLLPAYTGLNINTPSITPRGLANTQLGHDTDVRFGATLKDDGVTVNVGFNGFLTLSELIGDESAAALEADPDATIADFAEAGLDVTDETAMTVAGFVTISTIDGDYSATRRKRELLNVKLRDLSL